MICIGIQRYNQPPSSGPRKLRVLADPGSDAPYVIFEDVLSFGPDYQGTEKFFLTMAGEFVGGLFLATEQELSVVVTTTSFAGVEAQVVGDGGLSSPMMASDIVFDITDPTWMADYDLMQNFIRRVAHGVTS